MTETNETAPGGMNESAPGTEIGAKLTPPGSGFDPIDTRRQLIAKREAAGANTPLGHRCSNLIEQLQNYAQAESEDQRERLRDSIQKSMAEIAGLQQ